MAEIPPQGEAGDPKRLSVDQFILDEIDSVPHLEALLLAWNKRPKSWSVAEMSSAIYVADEAGKSILVELARRGLIAEEPASSGQYSYGAKSAEWDDFMSLLDRTYRRELIRISKLIHSKAPSAVHQFARAFRFTKEKDR